MKANFCSRLLAMLALLGIYGSAIAQDVTYLPTLPDSWTYPSDINNSGEAVGNSYSMSNFQSQAVRWVNGELSTLDGFSYSYASSINDEGVIAGSGAESVGFYVPVIWVDGVAEELPTLGFGGTACDVNNFGVVVGSVRTTEGGGSAPAVWRNGELTVLGTIQANGGFENNSGFAATIDDLGLISGVSYVDGVGQVPTQWIEDVPLALPVTFGVRYAGALGVNRTGGGRTSGYVIETRKFEDGSTYPVIVAVGWSADGYRVLQSLDENQSSCAYEVNELGVFAGYSRDSVGRDVPVLWTEEGITRLPYPSDLVARAVGLNETGLVIGYDSTSGVPQPLIWSVGGDVQMNMANMRAARGGNVSLSARVMQDNAGMAGQQVQFTVNGTVIGSGTTNRFGVARMTYRVPTTAKGKLAVAASMPGMPTIVRAIEIDTSRTTAGVAGNYDNQSGKLRMVAAVNAIEPNKPIANGRVNFFINGQRIASGTTDSRGVARAEVSLPGSVGAGAANIEARFLGDSLSRPITGRAKVGINR